MVGELLPSKTLSKNLTDLSENNYIPNLNKHLDLLKTYSAAKTSDEAYITIVMASLQILRKEILIIANKISKNNRSEPIKQIWACLMKWFDKVFCNIALKCFME